MRLTLGESNTVVVRAEPEMNRMNRVPKRKNSVVTTSDFKERFQGRHSLMNKEGHLGVVKNTKSPIVKRVTQVDLASPLIKDSGKQVAADQSYKKKNNYTPLVVSNNIPGSGFQNDERYTATPSPSNY